MVAIGRKILLPRETGIPCSMQSLTHAGIGTVLEEEDDEEAEEKTESRSDLPLARTTVIVHAIH